MTSPTVIAIDGPSASGKSSTAAAVAAKLGMTHVDTGALYRALTWLALEGELEDAATIVEAADARSLHLTPRDQRLIVVAGEDEDDIDEQIRSERVTAGVSAVAALPEIRAWVNRRLRVAVRATGWAVLDGRDIGTVVFPDAALKVFLTASPEARARRRLAQRGGTPTPDQVRHEAELLAARDRLDAARAEAPLRQAADAVLLDTTELTFDDQVARIVDLARDRGLPLS
ncbi:MAG: (d)CMP kinase [Gemmatimonadales bacterium]